ncbi:WD40 repeat domain-containing protein [Streptomyces sp. NPDC056231]|uniref:WD40 repeat domain-containing protein n=1 Tax=Streptomyces sp. NPDC056231 TaxID=3345755 RepID=UPI003AAE2299
MVGQASGVSGDACAISLAQVDRCLPDQKLRILSEWSVEAAGEAALAAWGWKLEEDPEAGRHWKPRARGVTVDTERGYRFRGRTTALTKIIQWIGGRYERRALVVTGSPGVGKSAVLGRIVTTADAAIAASLPPEDDGIRAPIGSVACAVHAKGKTALDVACEIARAASATLPAQIDDLPAALHSALVSRPVKGFTVVIDALDETVSAEQARLTVTRIVLPLVETCSDVGVRVLVATRPRDDEGNLLDVFGPAAEVINLDSSEFFEETDLAAYAEATLRLLGDERPGNPYLDHKVASPIARRIAELSERNFLVAGLVARTHGLYDDVAIRPEDVSFTPTVEAALRNYLQRLPDVGSVKAEVALSALAYAEAPGFPIDLWKTAVAAISGIDLSVAEVKNFARSSAANFLIETSSIDEVSQYRLFHQALNDALIAGRRDGSSRKEDERAIARSFIAEGRSLRWQNCSPYMFKSLPNHAHRGGILDEILVDNEYLLRCDLPRIIPLADDGASEATRHRAQLLRKVPQAIGATPEERVSLFSVSELQERLGSNFKEYPAHTPYRAEWTTVTPRSEEVTLEGHTGGVGALCAVKAGGRQLLASGSENGNLRLSDPSSGETVRVLEGHAGTVIALCSIQTGGRTLLASITADSTTSATRRANEVWLWDPTTGIKIRALNNDSKEAADTDAFALRSVRVGGNDLLAMAHFSGRVSIWDPLSGRCLRTVSSVNWVEAICTATLESREFLICSEAGDISIVDPRSGGIVRRLGEEDEGDISKDYYTGEQEINSICQVVVGGIPCVASASTMGVTLRRLDSGRATLTIEAPDEAIRGVCVVNDGETDLLAGFCNEVILLWCPQTGRVVRRLKGHTEDVLAICSVQVGRRAMLASSGVDNSVRLWDPNAAIGHTLSELTHGVHTVQSFSLQSRPSVLSCDYNGAVRLLSVKSGKTVRLIRRGPQGVGSVLSSQVAGKQVVLTGGLDGTIRMREPLALDEFVPIFQSHTAPVVAMCRVNVFDWSLIASADRSGLICVWDPISGECVLRIEDWYSAAYDVCGLPSGGDTLIACAGENWTGGSLAIMNPVTGEVVRKLCDQPDWVLCVEGFEVNGSNFLVTGGRDTLVRIWDPLSGNPIATLEGHTDWVTSVALFRSRGATILVSGGDDRTVRLWDPVEHRRLMEIPVYHPVTSISQVGRSLVVGSSAGILSLSIDMQLHELRR